MSSFVTVAEAEALFRPLTTEERERSEALLPLISDALRFEAQKVGQNLDEMIVENPSLGSTVKLVTVDVLSRVLRQSTTGELMSQETESANGFQWSGTYAIPGGGISNAIMNNDLKRLGIKKRMRMGVIDLWDGSVG